MKTYELDKLKKQLEDEKKNRDEIDKLKRELEEEKPKKIGRFI